MLLNKALKMYKIRGQYRKELKKELAKLKLFKRMFWMYVDVAETYGDPTSIEENKQRLAVIEEHIANYEFLLNEKINEQLNEGII